MSYLVLGDGLDNSALFASTISTTDGAYTFSASNVSSYGNANFGATGGTHICISL